MKTKNYKDLPDVVSVSELLNTGSIWQDTVQIIARSERNQNNNSKPQNSNCYKLTWDNTLRAKF
jgi:hypothetical protein